MMINITVGQARRGGEFRDGLLVYMCTIRLGSFLSVTVGSANFNPDVELCCLFLYSYRIGTGRTGHK